MTIYKERGGGGGGAILIVTCLSLLKTPVIIIFLFSSVLYTSFYRQAIMAHGFQKIIDQNAAKQIAGLCWNTGAAQQRAGSGGNTANPPNIL